MGAVYVDIILFILTYGVSMYFQYREFAKLKADEPTFPQTRTYKIANLANITSIIFLLNIADGLKTAKVLDEDTPTFIPILILGVIISILPTQWLYRKVSIRK